MQQRQARGYDSYSVSYHRAFSTNRPPGMLKVEPLRLPPLRLDRGGNPLRLRPRFPDGNGSDHDFTNRPGMSRSFDGSEERLGYDSISSDYDQEFAGTGSKLPPIKLQLHYLRQDTSPRTLNYSGLEQYHETNDNENEDLNTFTPLPDLPGHVVNRMTLKCYRVLPPIGYKEHINNKLLHKELDVAKGNAEQDQSDAIFSDTLKIGSRIKRSKSEYNQKGHAKLRHRVSADEKTLGIRDDANETKGPAKRRRSNSLHVQTRRNKSESNTIQGQTDDGLDHNEKHSPENGKESRDVAPADAKHVTDETMTYSQLSHDETQVQDDKSTVEKEMNSKGGAPKSAALPKDPSQMLQELRRKKKVKLKMEDVEKLWDKEMLEWIKQTGRRNAICEEMDPIYTDLAVIVGHNLLIQHLEEICMF